MSAVSLSDAISYADRRHKLVRAMMPRALGYENAKYAKSLDNIACVSLVALLILGCVGAAGQIPGPALGWTTVGLGGIFLSARLLMGGDRSKRIGILCAVALSSALIITLGALGGTGILLKQQVGIGLAALIPIHILVISLLIRPKVNLLVEAALKGKV